jgi:hypothetical protein
VVKIIKNLVLYLSFFLVLSASANSHPFYVSICQIDFNKESQTLEISVKTFVNDLIFALKNEGAPELFLDEERESRGADDYIFDYLKRNLKIKVNGKVTNYSFIGKELESDVVWSYLEITGVGQLNKIEVECSVLTEVFDSQSNIIQVTNGKGIRNLLLTKQKTVGEISFK